MIERLRDLWAGVGFYHLAHPDSPRGQMPDAWCGNNNGAQVVWWFTPLCRKCRRLSDADTSPLTHLLASEDGSRTASCGATEPGGAEQDDRLSFSVDRAYVDCAACYTVSRGQR